jgi:hypothetical protein
MQKLNFDQLSEFRKAASASPADAICDGWWLRYSKRKASVLTATLWPPGRGSTVEDWSRLGNILAAMGVPPTAKWPVSVTTDPGGSHTWSWLE